MPHTTRPRARRAHQLSLGEEVTRGRARHCLACCHPLDEDGVCAVCGGFPCAVCGQHTSGNGGDGRYCYLCLDGLRSARGR